ARIAVPTVHDQGHVDIEDVAVAQGLVVRNAVAHDMIDRGADRLAIAAVVQGRRVGAVVAREFEGESVEARGRNPRLDEGTYQIKRLRGQRASPADRGEVFRRVQMDL